MEILRKYSFARAPETVASPKPSTGLTMTPKGGVLLKIIPRT
ncbi:hypothetical protein GBAR_LOCUS20149 [Geodia barretti]|uniref:Uncharacterized protein n=1 Tax=Geodia barretti TaxID=519541 RepID=A0AA35X2S0_GEOBA|nr:hypothetical protein GBAR_LOCUS20149 [Geodia barretti]